MPAYVIAELEVRDPAAFERYRQMVPPTIAAFGGRYLARGGSCETLEGAWAPRRLVILEFPSMERAKQWWGSEEYAPAKALRQTCSRAQMVVLEGVPG